MPSAQEVPEHQHVPACDYYHCNVCSTCGSVHHSGGHLCLRCFMVERGWLPERGSDLYTTGRH